MLSLKNVSSDELHKNHIFFPLSQTLKSKNFSTSLLNLENHM